MQYQRLFNHALVAAMLAGCVAEPGDAGDGSGSDDGSGSGSDDAGGSGSGTGSGSGSSGLAEGSACTTPAECGADATCLYNPMKTSLTCRPSCNPDAPTCEASRHCMPLSDGWGACVPKPTSVSPWRVRVIDAKITTTVNFDPFGGKPDPYAMMREAGTGSYFSSPSQDDTFAPHWNYQFPPTYQYGQLALMALYLMDEDGNYDAEIVYFVSSLQPWWAGEVTRYTLLPYSSVQVTFEITPGT